VDTHILIQRHACNNSESNKDEKGENFADKLWLWLLLQFNFVAFAIHRFALVLALPFDRICTIWIPIKNRGKIYIRAYILSLKGNISRRCTVNFMWNWGLYYIMSVISWVLWVISWVYARRLLSIAAKSKIFYDSPIKKTVL